MCSCRSFAMDSGGHRRCVAAEAVNPCEIHWTNEPRSYNPFMVVHGGPQ